jgi:serine/threonine protein kinase
MIGRLLDQRYKITKSLSTGAFGYTFLAEDTKRPQNPICVIKQLKLRQSQPEYLDKAKELFDREAETLELLGRHSQIPCLLAHLEIDGEFYLIEEYIAGKTLAEEFAEKQNKSESEVIQIVSKLLKILAFVHQNNIIHRDIKPSNIIRNQKDSSLVLIDFGAVMKFDGETFLGTVIGTPGYIAPEQCLGRTGFYSDIYAVGIIGIQALTQTNPYLFAKDDRDEIIWKDKVSINQEFRDILTKMVRVNKSDRYQRVDEVLQDLNNIGFVISPTINISTNPIKKKALLPSLVILAATLLFWWLGIKFSKLSKINLPLNGKAINQELNKNHLCQDTILEQEIYCQKYTLSGEKKQEVTIEMNSNDFDPFLVLQKPDGDKLEANGDRSIKNWNAQIKAKLPSNGKYTVITRTTSPGESGKYTIRARATND